MQIGQKQDFYINRTSMEQNPILSFFSEVNVNYLLKLLSRQCKSE